MAKDAKQDLDRKNREYLAKKKAKREALAATKAGKKAKRSAENKAPAGVPSDETGQEPVTQRAAEPAIATPSEQTATSAASKEKPPSLAELKRQVKTRWPKVRGLADAKRTELVTLLAEGDQEIFEHYLQQWAKRAKERRERWLKGDSKSAQATRARVHDKTSKD